MTKPNNEIL